MTGFDVDDELFSYYRKKEIIKGFAQKPIRLENLVQEVKRTVALLRNVKCRFLRFTETSCLEIY